MYNIPVDTTTLAEGKIRLPNFRADAAWIKRRSLNKNHEDEVRPPLSFAEVFHEKGKVP